MHERVKHYCANTDNLFFFFFQRIFILHEMILSSDADFLGGPLLLSLHLIMIS